MKGDRSDIETGNGELEEGEEETTKNRFSSTTKKVGAAAAILIIIQVLAITASLGVLDTLTGQLMVGAALVNLIIAPISVRTSMKKDKYSGIVELCEQMKDQVDDFAEANKELSNQIEKMADSVGDLKELEGALSGITGSQDQNVKDIVKLVKDAKKVGEQTQNILKANTLQSMVELVLEAFGSSDSEIYLDQLGVEHLLMGLENVDGLNYNAKQVEKSIIESERTLKDILEIINQIAETSQIGEDLV